MIREKRLSAINNCFSSGFLDELTGTTGTLTRLTGHPHTNDTSLVNIRGGRLKNRTVTNDAADGQAVGGATGVKSGATTPVPSLCG